ncbi:MAG TPA: hypothetical protein VGM06_01200 [Polyangiaceae bacterium]|jgi:hypothetical protein
MATNTTTKSGVVALAQQLSAGTDKHLTGTTTVLLAGGSYTAADITAKLQSIVKLRTDVDAAKASAQAKLAVETTDMPALRSFMAAYVAFVKAAFVGAPDVLADFGLQTKARAPLTAEAKTAAVAKRKATRLARNTMGAKQKKAIKGTVTGIVVTPVVTPPPAESTPIGPSSPGPGGPTPATHTP